MQTIKISRYNGIGTAGATAKDKYRMESTIDRCTRLEAAISKGILAMQEAQHMLEQKIERLPEPYSGVLSRHYIHLQRFEQIAVDTHYSYRMIKYQHRKGVELYAKLN